MIAAPAQSRIRLVVSRATLVGRAANGVSDRFVIRQRDAAVARVREFVVPGAPYVEWVSPEQADMAEALERLKSPTGFLLR